MADNETSKRPIDWRFYVSIGLAILLGDFVTGLLQVGEKWTWSYELVYIVMVAVLFIGLTHLFTVLVPPKANRRTLGD